MLGIGSTDLKIDLSQALVDLKNEKIEKLNLSAFEKLTGFDQLYRIKHN